ncbi:acylpyruvase FAHD1, mitochondrial [Neodiprion virginianus]|uniref:acylpyruvase FAHD1, mitochondrial n=1 Tax=Neodiprion virginianus TaxID=2961670 RepID=UPI001EE6A24B|nr:acylpyruvase FAHD1, mitochondrial [Neodiprion virginianus]
MRSAAARVYCPVLRNSTNDEGASPYFSLKPSTSLVEEDKDICIPALYKDIKQETTLGVIIGTKCKSVEVKRAMNYVMGYCVAQDLTAVDQLIEAREKCQPWTLAKCFDTSCPVTRFIPYDALKDPQNAMLWCVVNGGPRQHANTKEMIRTIPELISFISKFMTLEKYDLILTGSPPYSGLIYPGDVIEFGIDDITSAVFSVDTE